MTNLGLHLTVIHYTMSLSTTNLDNIIAIKFVLGCFLLVWLKNVFFLGFAGGFNQPIMCGGQPRAMLKKVRGKADSPIYSIQICIPKHG